ncbi:hypothetical protein F11_06105 [Rhodospirillum rubrum F11]|nr:hypothetical protein F11_06105 [Rhodospirillum rubrum F11]
MTRLARRLHPPAGDRRLLTIFAWQCMFLPI